jgi:hypothetical protein
MAEVTLGYNIATAGWSSRFSFLPDWGVHLNNSMYTFKNGELYKHDTNSTRNAFYWNYATQDYYTYPSEITLVMNDSPVDTKDFRTIALDSDATWDVTVDTDMDSGMIDRDYFKDKEGNFYAYIRRNPNTIDFKATSTQGVGKLGSISGNDLNFSFNISSQISVGDKVYFASGAFFNLIGTITGYDNNTITVSSVTIVPSPGDMIVVIKDSTAESYGARGYYMDVSIRNNDTQLVEIFSISSEYSQSMP